MRQRRRQRHRGVGALLVVGAVAVGLLGGCTLSEVPVAVVGYDRNGTLVVGATDCSFTGIGPDEIDVILNSEGRGPEEIWSIESDDFSTGSSFPVRTNLPPPLAPEPSSFDEVHLVAVGDPDPPGWVIRTPLSAPIPEGGQLTIEVDADPGGGAWATVQAPRRRGPDLYAARVGGERVTDVSGADLLTRIQDTCDDATAFDGGLFLAVTGGTAGGLLVLAIPIGMVLARQFRRAGTAARARRAGQGLPASA